MQEHSPREEITRAPADIHRIVSSLAAKHIAITATLRAGNLRYETFIRHVDPYGQFLVVESSTDPAVMAAVLERPRCSFFAVQGDWHVEFVLSSPKEATHEGVSALQFGFPDVLSYYQRRVHERRPLPSPLTCVADTGGVISFKATIVDLSPAGTSFLIYDPNITLEPGTVLRSCRIEIPGAETLVVDLEVRYSEIGTLPDGKKVVRSGCRFVDAKSVAARLEALRLLR